MAKRRRTTTEWLQEVIARRDDMTEAARQSFDALETAAREHTEALQRACAACERRRSDADREGLARRWLSVLAWAYYAIMVEYPDGDTDAVGAAQEAYDNLIELAAGWLDTTWWVERRINDDEEAEAKRLAVRLLTNGLSEPEDVAATVRARVVERYRQAGEPLPRWLLGQAAREFIDDFDDL